MTYTYDNILMLLAALIGVFCIIILPTLIGLVWGSFTKKWEKFEKAMNKNTEAIDANSKALLILSTRFDMNSKNVEKIPKMEQDINWAFQKFRELQGGKDGDLK